MPQSFLRTIVLHQPRRLVFGTGCMADFLEAVVGNVRGPALVLTSPPTMEPAEQLKRDLQSNGIETSIYDKIDREPTIGMFEKALTHAQNVRANVIVGVGGGSVLDVAKLVAALLEGNQDVREVFGIGKLADRSAYSVSFPTTAGTGSEVSPNAILLDEREKLKKGVVSPCLVPDATYIDPTLTLTVPPALTAATGMDALTHCIEAYANRNAHPVVDMYALEGIRLIAAHLQRAVANGKDIEARGSLALGSLYGGLCLGPVNTAAVHALAYPLGGEFGVPHGLANALLLPHVMAFNLTVMSRRYADIALALGVTAGSSTQDTAQRGLERIHELLHRCGLTSRLSELGVPEEAIQRMASSAMQVTRLLQNNPREMTAADADAIYRRVY